MAPDDFAKLDEIIEGYEEKGTSEPKLEKSLVQTIISGATDIGKTFFNRSYLELCNVNNDNEIIKNTIINNNIKFNNNTTINNNTVINTNNNTNSNTIMNNINNANNNTIKNNANDIIFNN